MKTAVSIPGDLFEAAERKAERLGISRSALYAQALEHLLKEDFDAEISRQIDEACKDIDTSLDPVFEALQSRSLFEPW